MHKGYINTEIRIFKKSVIFYKKFTFPTITTAPSLLLGAVVRDELS